MNCGTVHVLYIYEMNNSETVLIRSLHEAREQLSCRIIGQSVIESCKYEHFIQGSTLVHLYACFTCRLVR